jgi:hypothetical protein
MVLATLGSANLQEPDLRAWLEVHAGLVGKKLQTALALCEDEEIETVGDLREVRVGFSRTIALHCRSSISYQIR